MKSTMIHRHGEGRPARTLCDILGILLGLLVLIASLLLLYGTVHHIASGGNLNSGLGCGLGAGVLLFLGTCLALPTRLYEDKRLRIAGHLAASMTSAVTVASAVLPLVALVSVWTSKPSPGSAAADVGGIVVFIVTVIGLAGILIFLPCTYILARKAKPRLAHLAIGTIAVGVVGGLLGYLCY
jgi:hypothetical protein